MKTIAMLCAGFDLVAVGAIAAGYKPIWSLEINPVLAEVAEVNLKHKIYVESIIGFNWAKAERPDHLHISPPCQNASIANPNQGETDLDLAIADACIGAINCYQPDSFTLENVRGYQAFKAFHKIVACLRELGYWVNADVLNAADFGVPQTRKRLIVRAFRGGFPLPLYTVDRRVGWYEAIADLIPNLKESSFADWQLNLLPEFYKSILTYSCANSSTLKAFLVNGTANNGQSVTVVDDHDPCFTITASQSKRPLRAWLNNGCVVVLNSRAIARLQTLPDWYQLPEKNEIAGIGIGNGVPCLMAQRILESIG